MSLSSPFSMAQVDEKAAKVDLSFVGVEGPILANIKRHVGLYARLQSSAPLSKGEIRRLKRHVSGEIQEAVQPFGYYLATARLLPNEVATKLVYQVDLNQPVLVKRLSLKIVGTESQKKVFNDWLSRYPLTTGQVLDQAIYEREKKAILALALRLGYFDAKLKVSEIVINQARTEAGININFVTGNQYTLSAINVDWDLSGSSSDSKRRIQESLIDSHITMKAGDAFDADELVNTQRGLLATPYFSSVSVQAGEPERSNSTLAINVTLVPRKRHTYSAEVGVGTDTGFRGGVGYENRRINSRGHNLNARLGGSEIKRSAIVNYRIPRKRSALDSLNFFASLEEELGDSRRFDSTKVGTELLYSWHDSLLKFGLTASRETFFRLADQNFETEYVTDLLMPSVRWERTKADELYFPTKGWSASATLRAASKNVGSDIDLAQLILEAKRLYTLGNGRLRLRFKLGGSLINEAVNLPESLGFLAGGDDSVRGYGFESIGVNRNGQTTIGKNLIIGSVEYEHPIRNGISWATFIDAGDAFDGGADYKKGAGVGLRWRLPFGALRLDAASALDKEGNPVRMHFSFGTDL